MVAHHCNFFCGKRRPKFWATFVIFKEKHPKENSHPMVKKIAQSGHPEEQQSMAPLFP
jgi:hypothetical protein